MFLLKKINLLKHNFVLNIEFQYQIIHSISPDSEILLSKKKPVLHINQASQFSGEYFKVSVNTVLLPGCTFLEKRSIYMNLFARFQFTNIVFKPLRLALEDWRIVINVYNCFKLSFKLFYPSLFENFKLSNHKPYNSYLHQDKPQSILFYRVKHDTFSSFRFRKDFFFISPVTFWLNSFYFTDAITKNSKQLSVCSKTHAYKYAL
jgi:NADH dehydrogenase/NADH:ubiquinone oxidoreductase subunit G